MNTENYYQKYYTTDQIKQIEQVQEQSLSSEELYAMICHMDSQYLQAKELVSIEGDLQLMMEKKEIENIEFKPEEPLLLSIISKSGFSNDAIKYAEAYRPNLKLIHGDLIIKPERIYA